MKATERKAALSLARMEKVKRDLALRDQIEAERTELKARYRMKPAELRRQRIEDKDGRHPEAAPIMKPAAPAGYKVDQDGNVTYYDQQRRAMFTDTGSAVEFSQTERDTLETGLRLALAKFGPSIRLRGGDEAYRHAMADIAADKGLYAEFSEERYEQRREAIKAGRAYMAQAARPSRNRSAHHATPAAAGSALLFWRHRGDLATAAASPCVNELMAALLACPLVIYSNE